METNLEIVRQACIKANPAIMELGFGCQVKYQNEVWNVAKNVENAVLLAHTDGIRVTRFGNFYGSIEKYNLEILGRPIRLADVLLAIHKTEGKTFLMQSWCNDVCNDWNLIKDSLDDQTEETVAFLANLLK